MSGLVGGIFNFADRLQMESLNQRLKRSEVISGNIANAETPGFRALGYDFEEQLASTAHLDSKLSMQVSSLKHFRSGNTTADGNIKPDVYIKPQESIGQDGNTVDVDDEMARMAQNQILYRSAVEIVNRKVGMLKYAINGGR